LQFKISRLFDQGGRDLGVFGRFRESEKNRRLTREIFSPDHCNFPRYSLRPSANHHAPVRDPVPADMYKNEHSDFRATPCWALADSTQDSSQGRIQIEQKRNADAARTVEAEAVSCPSYDGGCGDCDRDGGVGVIAAGAGERRARRNGWRSLKCLDIDFCRCACESPAVMCRSVPSTQQTQKEGKT
jgi:hypothetical protein